jgi:hypothetical protein
MKRNQIFKYYAFGYNYCSISFLLVGRPLDYVHDMLSKYFVFIDELELSVTKQAASQLRELLKSEVNATSTAIIDEVLFNRIKSMLAAVDSTLDAELKIRYTYIMTTKRFPINTLMESPKDLLGLDVYDKLTDTAKKDFKLGCQQIAFESPTAAAFHFMRCIEEEIKELYFKFKKTKRLERPMWGPMLDQLMKKKKPKPEDSLLDHLNSIRKHYRNPTQHPEKFFNVDEAQDLLNDTINALNRIINSLS